MRRNVKHGESGRWQVPFVTRREKVGRAHQHSVKEGATDGGEVAWKEGDPLEWIEAINPKDNDRLPLQDRGQPQYTTFQLGEAEAPLLRH